MAVLTVKPISKKFEILYQKARYKVLYGGRASAKSWAVAEALIYFAIKYKTRILCVRQVQKSISDSSYRLICDTINRLGVSEHFDITKNEIRCLLTGSVFIFKGLSGVTEESIKSLEGIDLVWCEESQKLTKRSINILIPTIRKRGSQIIFTFNPTLITDAVSQIFLGDTLPPNTLIEKINYLDNPKCSPETIADAEFCKESNPSEYAHIWLGEHISAGDQQIFSSEDVFNSYTVTPLYTEDPVVAGLDVARYGDDKTTLFIRQGNREIAKRSWSKLSNPQVATHAMNLIHEFSIKKLIIDVSGGYGGGVADILKEQLNQELCEIVEFYGSSKSSSNRYINARAETYFKARDWLRDGGLLYKDASLEEEMIIIQYKYNTKHQMQVESKDDLKKADRLGRSPDMLDAFTMTFYDESSSDIDLKALVNGNSVW